MPKWKCTNPNIPEKCPSEGGPLFSCHRKHKTWGHKPQTLNPIRCTLPRAPPPPHHTEENASRNLWTQASSSSFLWKQKRKSSQRERKGGKGQNPQHIHTQLPETQPSRRKQTDVSNGEEGEWSWWEISLHRTSKKRTTLMQISATNRKGWEGKGRQK